MKTALALTATSLILYIIAVALVCFVRWDCELIFISDWNMLGRGAFFAVAFVCNYIIAALLHPELV